jgi:hypothetical protein
VKKVLDEDAEMKRAAFIFASLCLALSCYGRTITVDNDGPAEYATIQEAIDAAAEGDEIVVAVGTYSENIHFKGKNIVLSSINPTDQGIVNTTVIDGNNANSVVTFSGTEANNCVLSGFTITKGIALEGGGINGNGTLATIEYNVIIDNCAKYGGGVSRCDGIIKHNSILENYNVNYDNRPVYFGHGGGLYLCDGTIVSNNIIRNTADHSGGGLYGGNGTIENNTFTDNSAFSGGAISRCDGTIQGNIFTGNSAWGGGAIAACDGTIQNNTISTNVATYGGGGLSTCWGTVRNNIIRNNTVIGPYYDNAGGGLHGCHAIIEGNIIIGNSARHGGGLHQCGEFLLWDSNDGWPTFIDATIHNNLIIANLAYEDGGGLCWCRGTISNNTIYGNHAGDLGGGLRYCGGIIVNCIVYGNTSNGLDTQISGCAPAFCAAPSYCCIQDWTGEGVGNIAADPCFADISSSDPNEWDVHLRSQAGRWDPQSQIWVEDDVTSFCIDAGDPFSPVGHESFPNGGIINMGAYGGTAEASKSYFGEPVCETIVAGDIDGDCNVNFLDFRLIAIHWLEDHSP